MIGARAVCTKFHIGNASEKDIIDITEGYDPSKIPEAKAILESGMGGLLNWAKIKGVEPDSEGYYNVCHMCTDLRRRANRMNCQGDGKPTNRKDVASSW